MIVASIVYLNGVVTNKAAQEGYKQSDANVQFNAPFDEGNALKIGSERIFDSVKEKGGRVSVQMSMRMTYYKDSIYAPVDLRFFDDYNYNTPIIYTDLAQKCILNVEAANALKVKNGDTLQLDFLASPLQVLRVMPTDFTPINMESVGCVTLDPSLFGDALAFVGQEKDLDWAFRIDIDDDLKIQNELNELGQVIKNAGYFARVNDGIDTGWIFESSFTTNKAIPHLNAVVCLTIAMLGMLALLHLKEIRLSKQNAVLRLIGMTRTDSILLSLFDSGILSLISCVTGTLAGSIIFLFNSEQMTGVVLTIPALLMESSVLFLINMAMCFAVAFACHLWMYDKVFSSNIAAILQKRGIGIRGRKPVLWLIVGWLVYSLIALLVFDSAYTLTFVLFALLILLLCYILFSLILTVLRRFRFKIRNIWLAAFVFVTRRKQFIAVTGTVAVVLSLCLIITYNALFGFGNFIDDMMEEEIALNTAVIEIPPHKLDTVKSYLSEQGHDFVTTYTKVFIMDNPGHFESISLAVIDDKRQTTKNIAPGKGLFSAADYVIFRGLLPQSKVSDNLYEFSGFFSEDADSLTLRYLANSMPNQHVHSTTGFNIGINYEDAYEYIDDSFMIGLSLRMNEKQQKELISWAQVNQLQVETAASSLSRNSVILHYIIFIVALAIVLLFITVLVFCFSLSHASILSRNHEILMYKMLGAGKRQINILLIMENIYISISATLVSLLVNHFIINAISRSIVDLTLYSIPIYIVICIFLITLAVSFFTSWVAIKIMGIENPAKVLRV
jgi:ABC-type antimicrobial peptide transport system permease subunit